MSNPHGYITDVKEENDPKISVFTREAMPVHFDGMFRIKKGTENESEIPLYVPPPLPSLFFYIYSYFSLLPKISVKREAMPVHVDGMSALKRAPIMKSFIPFLSFFSFPHHTEEIYSFVSFSPLFST